MTDDADVRIPLTFTAYQAAALTTAVFPRVFVEAPDGAHVEATWIYPSMGLAGEAGEVLEKLKKIVRDKSGRLDDADRTAIGKELGDLLWYVAALASKAGLDLDQIAINNLVKLADRKARGVLKGSGDDR